MSVSTQKPDAVLKILEELDGIGQWREEQFQRFKEKQTQSTSNLLEIPAMAAPKKSAQVLKQQRIEVAECSNGQPIENSLASFNSNTTADSSVTGHILRCFNDSTECNPVVSRTNAKNTVEKPNNKVVEENYHLPPVSAKKPVRPFLRKGSGLNRYYKSKSAKQVKTSDEKSPEQQEPTLEFKQDKNSSKGLHNFISSQKNPKVPVQRNYVQFKEREPVFSNRGVGFEIPTNEQLKDCHTNVNGENYLAQTESNKTDFRKFNSAVSVANRPNPVMNYDKISELTSIPVKNIDEITDDDVDDRDLSPALDNNIDCDNLNQSESEKNELAEFEILEKCAQNSSFNSDSSIMQRVLRGEPLIPQKQEVPDNARLNHQYAATRNSFDFKSLNLSDFRKKVQEAQARRKPEGNCAIKAQQESYDSKEKQMEIINTRIKQIEINDIKEKKMESIHAIMSDAEQRLDNLQKEISSNHKVFLENENFGSERCSTPLITLPELANPLSSDLDQNLPSNYANGDYGNLEGNCEDANCRTKEASDALLRDSFHLIENEDALFDKQSSPNHQLSDIKEIMKEKIAQLQKEIETYQKLNSDLKKISKETQETSRKLKKEYGDLEKYKAEQKKKIDEEVEKERQQIKRERESLNRLKKMQKENFSRKEREELSALRKENEQLQEELKRQRMKFNSDVRRMKSQLVAAQNEHENARLKVITLEEQVEDLLNTLKARRPKTKTSGSTASNKIDHIEESEQNTDDSSSIDSNEKKDTNKRKITSDKVPHSNKSVKTNSSKPRVRFNLPPQFETSQEDITPQESGDSKKDDSINQSDKSLNIEHENSADSESKDSENKSSESSTSDNIFNSKNPVERILPSGDRDITYPSGTKKTINVDGTIFIKFHNGDTKYIFPNKHEIHNFQNGIIEESFPDGSKQTEFPNGQVEYLMPDGVKEIRFPEGYVQVIHPDGFEIIEGINGKKTVVQPDGTSIFYCENGDTEIRTSTYKKREYADGSMRVVYINGRRETRYSNGRIKIRDADGKVIYDTKNFARGPRT